ncbi:uncharacterized protein LOC141588002 [Silene latifolia]|uniref:uncharacterized protein LOC141588002 n=1 Tax=Silene latifolia TaxID=37657 RepID=UPI003D784A35
MLSLDKGKEKVADPLTVRRIPYPGRLKDVKVERQFGKFVDVVKNLQVTIPFTKLITQVPSYAKFIKDILRRKRELNEFETVAFMEQSRNFILNKALPKLKDPGSFSITCIIRNEVIEKALCDLGANASVMPYFVFKKLNMGRLKMTNITL